MSRRLRLWRTVSENKHDDLVDSMTHALKHLRDNSLAQTDEEVVAEENERMRVMPRVPYADSTLPVEKILEFVSYDPKTGDFTGELPVTRFAEGSSGTIEKNGDDRNCSKGILGAPIGLVCPLRKVADAAGRRCS
jgi:hypothetical protein